jgi:peroxiredoxin Q/BCP
MISLFIGLPDPDYSVLKLYGQEVNLFKLGRMPAQVIIDRDGIARFVHYGKSMSDIPSNKELLALLDSINEIRLDKVAL